MTVVLVVPPKFEDARGWFSETWNDRTYDVLKVQSPFCQDNHSLSRQAGTIRGLHFQRPPDAQAKLVRCLRGRIFDVAVDIRKDSPTFGQWVGAELTAERGNQLFIPRGYAHAFLTLEDDVEVAYKVDAYYAPQSDGGIIWNDPDLAIDWPVLDLAPLLSDKDAKLPRLKDIRVDFPYDGNPLLPLNLES